MTSPSVVLVDRPAPLWHVGAAVKDYGDGGTQACAYTARVAAERVLARFAAAKAA